MLGYMAGTLQERPARTYVTGPVTGWIRRLSIAVTLLCTITVAVLYWTLPETVATHFNIAGEADDWGPRGSVWLLVGIFTAMNLGMSFLSRHPRAFNYPVTITEGNAQGLYRAGEQLMVWIVASCTLLYVGITGATLEVFSPTVILVPAVVCMFASLIVGLVRMLRV